MKLYSKTVFQTFLDKGHKDYVYFIFTFFENNNEVQFKLIGSSFNIEDLELFVEKIKKNESCSIKQKYYYKQTDEILEIIYDKDISYYIFNYKYVTIRIKKMYEIINLFDNICIDLKSININI